MVLIVEDYRDWQVLLKSLLEKAGFTVLTASSAEEGLVYLRSNDEIQLIITDLGLPNMQGCEFIKLIRNGDKKHLPIIVFSSSRDTMGIAKRVNANVAVIKGAVNANEDVIAHAKAFLAIHV